MSDLLTSVLKLVEQADKFGTMQPPQQAAFRARLTRYLNEVTDEEVKGILLGIQNEVGTAVKKSTQKLTAETIEAEFKEAYAGYDTQKRGAFKAKVTRLLNEAREGGDQETQMRLAAVQLKADDFESKEVKAKLLALAKNRKKVS